MKAQIAYKLTDKHGRTHGDTQWGEGVTHRATGKGWEFCSPDLIHYYDHPLLAVLLNPIHANYQRPLLWSSLAWKTLSDHGLKGGAKTLRTMRQIPLPVVSITQKVAFGILAAKQVYKPAKWNRWAEDWLSGRDRSAAAYASYPAARYAARYAAYAAHAAAYAYYAYAAAYAAYAAHAATATAAYAATATPLDLVALAHQAMQVKET